MKKLTKDNEILYIGEENDCWMKLQHIQPQSAHYATTWGGYKVENATEKDIDNRIEQLKKQIESSNSMLIFKLRDERELESLNDWILKKEKA